MKSDAMLRSDIVAELNFDPAVTVNATDIGVIVKDGVVTLSGHPTSHAEKHAIERAVQRVKGVKALAVEMSVRIPAGGERTDADIAAAAENALEWNVLVPDDAVHPMVEDGWVTLNGRVEWDYQRRAAEVAVRNLLGVKGVTDLVEVKARFTPADVERKITEALQRQADRDARHIQVLVNGGQVTLRGTVKSWAERRAAQGAAWSAPGVANVVNNLLVEA
ncbi:BON domain-containing protein [Variovorax sp. J2P1-59]|uniref:BON domain-containing protein n=1 Tax=Variovorax flavidus TaxID=3053501 RepID=UPI00257732FC|nr:BON domain-containing protein [Variovorax sp. J2P1-59]MDM0078609.1 BON domain-containing protein [Variovorax sp. J2P1-59]